MAAWTDEVGEVPLRRVIIGEPIVLFRKVDGAVAALTDRCPHRFARLSDGTRSGDTLQCPYHGLAFDADGACVLNPYSDSLPKGAAVSVWPVCERDGIVWIWTGAQEKADQGLLPDFSRLVRAGVPPVHGWMMMNAPYEYATDNLMDLSHIEFVHKGTFAGNGVIFAGKHELSQEDDTLHSNWWMPNVPAPTHTMGHYPADLVTDHWLDMRWNAPASMALEVGATPAGEAREGGVIVQQAHILTPETETTSHYFWATSRTTDTVDPQMDGALASLLTQAFTEEDKPVIERSFENLFGRDFWEAQPLYLGIDAGGTRARRLLQTMIAEEAQTSG